MTQLAQLPGDVLAHILLGRDVSFSVITLWKTGNTLLTATLANSITYVNLKDIERTSTSRWPKCLSSLQNLQYLTINRSSGYLMGSEAQLSTEIRQLSPKLRLLCIESLDAVKAFFNYANGGSVIETLYDKGLSRLFDIQATFPALETLHAQGVDRGEPSSFPAQDLCGLPDYLTFLYLPPTLQVDPSHLPRRLQAIDTSITFRSSDSQRTFTSLVACLPPSLVRGVIFSS